MDAAAAGYTENVAVQSTGGSFLPSSWCSEALTTNLTSGAFRLLPGGEPYQFNPGEGSAHYVPNGPV